MPHDPEFVAETREWLSRAENDLQAAALLRVADSRLAGSALFHCQQAAEKALKGFLTWHGRTFRKTHNIGELGSVVVEILPKLLPAIRAGTGLTDYAWKFRYPGDVEDPTPEQMDEALRLAQDLCGCRG